MNVGLKALFVSLFFVPNLSFALLFVPSWPVPADCGANRCVMGFIPATDSEAEIVINNSSDVDQKVIVEVFARNGAGVQDPIVGSDTFFCSGETGFLFGGNNYCMSNLSYAIIKKFESMTYRVKINVSLANEPKKGVMYRIQAADTNGQPNGNVEAHLKVFRTDAWAGVAVAIPVAGGLSTVQFFQINQGRPF